MSIVLLLPFISLCINPERYGNRNKWEPTIVYMGRKKDQLLNGVGCLKLVGKCKIKCFEIFS